MTTGTLALIILVAILAQVSLAVLFGIFRRRRQSRDLEGHGGEPRTLAAAPASEMPAIGPSSPGEAWTGFREFSVQRRQFEDEGRSVCSFYLVPARMVAGTEGREFTVAITNLGPDTAGGTVTVTAVTLDNVPIPSFPREYPFSDLAGGENESWTESFVIDLGYATTVTWTATIEADHDVNLGNNEVTETTVVKLTSGGGHP